MSSKRKWSDSQLREAVRKSVSYSQILREIGLSTSPGNFKTIQKYITALGIDISHLKGKGHGTSKLKNARELHEYLVEGGPQIGSSILKKKLLRANVLKSECDECGNTGSWNGKPLCLQLDHKDGNPSNNSITNLRILCPNCHSQTDTFKRGCVPSRYK